MKRASATSRDDGSPDANERFKRRWGAWVGWSTVAAVAIHAAVFALTAWDVLVLGPDPTRFEGRSLMLLQPAAAETSSGGIPSPAPPIPVAREADEADPTEPVTRDGMGTDEDLGELWDRLNRRLGDRSALVPTLADPETVESTPQEAEPTPDRDLDIRGEEGALSELVVLPESDSLDLGRLDEIRAELALLAPSAWVLIRNPLEVEAYLRGGYARGRIDPSAAGSVSVTLWIDEHGSVEWAEVSQSSGSRDLDEFALALFNEVAVFRPAREEGVRVSRSVSFALNFPW